MSEREEHDPTEFRLEQAGVQAERLFPLVYEELKSIARTHLSRVKGEEVLQPTALVHEVYLRLIDQTRIDANGRNHFLALAARTLHRVLIDHIRAARGEKRGGAQGRVTLRSDLLVQHADSIDLLDLEAALVKLAATNARRAQVVELRFYGGLTNEEVAGVLAVSVRTVKNEWTVARAFLFRELGEREK